MPLAWRWPIHVLGVAMDLEKAVAIERMANNGMLHVEIVADIDRRLAVDHFRGRQPGLKVVSRWAEGVEHKVVAERVCKEYFDDNDATHSRTKIFFQDAVTARL